MSDLPKVPADDVATMAREITLGISSDNSSPEMTPEHLKSWRQLKSQIDEIICRGGIVEIPD